MRRILSIEQVAVADTADDARTIVDSISTGRDLGRPAARDHGVVFAPDKHFAIDPWTRLVLCRVPGLFDRLYLTQSSQNERISPTRSFQCRFLQLIEAFGPVNG
ncbi:hypothetical protein [Sphingomonas faeni]|uniref:hypothetical protein n=1 Tax=Sphingomonas faeni TaxID=185950 RepID=UPI0020C7FD34|nr:hypothetical protein [Sphingomonas faeni]MCP8889292.1 hypothetical protein [Sphingomonas faeni]